MHYRRVHKAFNNIIVLNLPNQFIHLPKSFDEFYENLNTIKYKRK
jgi:hypothetical protein